MTLIRLSLKELRRRAGVRRVGYYEACVKRGRLLEGERLEIDQDGLREIWAAHSAPGLGDELGRGCEGCGG